MDEAIAGFRGRLRLTEDEGQRLVLPGGLWHAESDTYRLCLVGRLLSRLVGFWDMDMDDTGCTWGATLRLLVAINVNRPLPHALPIVSTLGDELLVHVTYERLPNFCYLSGKLGHIAKYYEVQFEEGFVDPGSDSPYGSWLRAPLPVRGRGLTHRRESGFVSKQGPVPDPGQPCGAAVFGSFSYSERVVSAEQGDKGEAHREGVRAVSAESFNPGRSGRQGRVVFSEGVVQDMAAADDPGSEDSLMDNAGLEFGVSAFSKDVFESEVALEQGAETSVEFVPSTIPESGPGGGGRGGQHWCRLWLRTGLRVVWSWCHFGSLQGASRAVGVEVAGAGRADLVGGVKVRAEGF
ncbi:hypothetical protein Salat_2606800 [Sesamum alatum]|uniref:Uncharacterized protein n=1 Tax=Sesamum alatum TaxID=300844 RepID=A0AAE1XN78_9LAMI|nr:hypothetical protein Salat_2606800 [Sesamum alatum]